MTLLHQLPTAVTISGAAAKAGAQAAIVGGSLLVGFGGLKTLGHYLGDRHAKVGISVLMMIVVGAIFVGGGALIHSLIHDQSNQLLK